MSFETLPYSAAESAAALSGASARSYSTGKSPGLASDGTNLAPISRLALNVSVSGYSAGEVDLIVQTAPSEADADGEWVDTDSRINGIVANGNYTLEVTDPIMDKVRIAYVPNTGASAGATFTGTVTGRWLCDGPIN